MASGQSSEIHAGEPEDKRRKVYSRDRDYHSLSGETYAGVQDWQGDQRPSYPSNQSLQSNSECRRDSVIVRRSNLPSQTTQELTSDRLGIGIQAGQDYPGQHNPESQRLPSSSEVQSDPSNTQPNLSQITQEILSNSMRSGNEGAQDDMRHNSEQTQLPVCNEGRNDSFSKILYGLSQDITNAKFKGLKDLCMEKLSRRELESLKEPYDLFDALRQKGLIHESDTAMLESLLCEIGLNAMVKNYLKPSAIQGVKSDQLLRLVKLLKDKYKSHYATLSPIPWSDDIKLNLHEVYTRLEVKEVKRGSAKVGTKLKNLHDMFTLSGGRRIRIEGAPAMGKSTLCRKLAYDWSCGELQQYTLLFFLEMRHVVKHEISAEILHQLIPDDFDLSKQELSELISKYKESLLFLCDGLDELDDSHLTHTDIPKLIAGNLYYWCTAVITTRPHLCDKYLRKCDLFLQVKGFTAKRTNEYISKYFTGDPDRGVLLIQQIEKQTESTHFITDLLKNPLHVSFLCILWQYHKLEGDYFPETLTELYSDILECIIKRYCAKNNIEFIDGEVPQIILNEMDKLASDSYSAYKNNKINFDKSDISSEACLNFGLLVKDLGHAIRKATEIYYFYHKTWLEYFTALHVSSQMKAQNTTILNEFIKHARKHFLVLKFIAGIVTEQDGNLFFTELNKKLQDMHRNLQHLNTDCRKQRKALVSLQNLYGDFIKCLIESKCSDAFITCFDVLSKGSIIYSHQNNKQDMIYYSDHFLLDFECENITKLDKKCCSFQNFLHMLQLIGKNSMTLDTLCVLGFKDKKINSFLEILKGNPNLVKSLTIYSGPMLTLTDVDNLAAIRKNFRGESITLSLNVDAGNGGNNSRLKNVLERIKDNTSVKCFKFEAYQCDDILQAMTHNGTQEIVCIVPSGYSLTDASVNALCTFLENCDSTKSLKFYMFDLCRSYFILKMKTALMKISPCLKSMHFVYLHNELYNALSANMTLNDIGMRIANKTDESVCSVIKQNKYAKSMTLYNFYYGFKDERCQSIAAALRENKVLKHLKIETIYDYNAPSVMNNLLIPVSKEIETNQVTLDSITLWAFIRQTSPVCTELQSIVSQQEKPDNWYHNVYPSVYSDGHNHLIRYTSEHSSNAM